MVEYCDDKDIYLCSHTDTCHYQNYLKRFLSSQWKQFFGILAVQYNNSILGRASHWKSFGKG